MDPDPELGKFKAGPGSRKVHSGSATLYEKTTKIMYCLFTLASAALWLVVKPVLLLEEYSTTISCPFSSRNPYLPTYTQQQYQLIEARFLVIWPSRDPIWMPFQCHLNGGNTLNRGYEGWIYRCWYKTWSPPKRREKKK